MYEAGPTGYGLARALERAGVDFLIAAPGKIAPPATDWVKTDRRDARADRAAADGRPVERGAGAELGRGGDARPGPRPEDVRGDLMRARHRVAKQLLRHDRRFGGNNWTQAHHEWVADVELDETVARLRCYEQPPRGDARF